MKIHRLEIESPRPGAGLIVELGDILDALRGIGESFLWYVLDWEGRSAPGPAMYGLQAALQDGVVAVPWEALGALAAEIRQTDDALIVGVRGIHRVPVVPLVRDMQAGRVRIECLSNMLWACETDVDEVITAFERAFSRTQRLSRVELRQD